MVLPAQGCGRALRRTLAPAIAAAAEVPTADRYRKHFPVTAHLWILLLHTLTGSDSLRQTHADLAGTPGAWHRLGLPDDTGISRSQLARSSTSRPIACAETLFATIAQQARARAQADPDLEHLQQIQAVDSSFLRLSAALSPWSRYGGHVAGVRLHTGLDLAGTIPTALRLTLTNMHDLTALAARDLTPLAGWTLLIDLGYDAHRLFEQLRMAEVSFVCRLQAQASYRVEAERPVDGPPTTEGDVVLRDQTITLGSPNNRNGAVLPGMRLVVSHNAAGTEHAFVTDRHDLRAAEVVRLYRKRWQIELFFRFLKHQLKVLQPFGTSRDAIWLTILIAATTALIVTLIEARRPPDATRVAWLRGVGRALGSASLRPKRSGLDTS